MNKLGRLNRRQLMKSVGFAAAGGSLGLGSMLASRRGLAQNQEKKPRFLIVIAAGGGASIIDSFLAIPRSLSANPGTIHTLPDDAIFSPEGSPLRAVDQSGSEAGAIPIAWSANQSNFLRKNVNDILVATCTGTSVNHNVAQRRSLTGNEIWKGRTLQECVAAEYGATFPVPNVNMAGQGYSERGYDRDLPDFAVHEPVAGASVWPLGLDGALGINDLPSKELIVAARELRNQRLDPNTAFYRTFKGSKNLAIWEKQRTVNQSSLEAGELIKKLIFLEDSQSIPLSEYGLTPSPDAAAVREKFPRYASDPFQAQAALAFLLLKNRVTTTVTIGPSFDVLLSNGLQGEIYNPPLAFDYSHNAHRASQAIMWSRLLAAADGLIDLLKAQEFDASTGESFWDRSMIYIATEFGRDKTRGNNANEFGTGHHLNNGFAIISPMVRGNRVLGGVNYNTGLTYGWNPTTGEPVPEEEMAERYIFSGILHALGVDTSGADLPNVTAFV